MSFQEYTYILLLNCFAFRIHVPSNRLSNDDICPHESETITLKSFCQMMLVIFISSLICAGLLFICILVRKCSLYHAEYALRISSDLRMAMFNPLNFRLKITCKGVSTFSIFFKSRSKTVDMNISAFCAGHFILHPLDKWAIHSATAVDRQHPSMINQGLV